MKQAKKVLLLVLCAVLLVGASVAGTVAYLTDDDEVKNTFTVGEVHINLDEVKVDENGDATDERTETGNAYHLLPGKTYSKEPAITVLANSEDCYVRAKITVTVPNWPADTTGEEFTVFAGSFAANYILSDATGTSGFNTQAWNPSTPSVDNGTIDTSTKTITYYLTYKDNSGIVTSSTEINVVLPALFNDIYVPDTLDNTTLSYLEGMKIDVEAHAIQAGGFVGADAAWAAFDVQ